MTGHARLGRRNGHTDANSRFFQDQGGVVEAKDVPDYDVLPFIR